MQQCNKRKTKPSKARQGIELTKQSNERTDTSRTGDSSVSSKERTQCAEGRSDQATFKTPNTFPPFFASSRFNPGRAAFPVLRGLITTSPQCFGTVPVPPRWTGC
jgi:hypothetical protein